MKTVSLMGFVLFLFAASVASAADCQVHVDSTDQMRYDTDSITIPSSCERFTVNLTHSGTLPKTAMGHNWVLTETANIEAVAQDGMSAGLDNHYIKPGDERVLAYTPVIGGGESTSVTFDVGILDKSKSYSFLCTFPGHYALMKGAVTIN